MAALEPPDLLVWINLFAFGGLEATFLWPLLLGLYWRKANAAGALSSILVGVACFFALSVLKPPMYGIHAIVPSTLAALLAFLGKIRFTPQDKKKIWPILTGGAAAVGTAVLFMVLTVAVFGPTDLTATGPVSDSWWLIRGTADCAPCFRRECPGGSAGCIAGIGPGEVIAAVREICARYAVNLQ